MKIILNFGITKLKIAIKEKKEIKFDYEKYNFYVKPLKLAFFDGFWYLLAFHIQKDKEIFKKKHTNLEKLSSFY